MKRWIARVTLASLAFLCLGFPASNSFAAFPATTQAQSARQEKVPPTVPASAKHDAYDFATAVIDGIASYMDGEETIAASPVGMADIVASLAAMRTAESKWRLAAVDLALFPRSKDTAVAKFSKNLGDSYTMMAELYGRRVSLMESILKQSVTAADVTIEASKIQSQAQQVFELVAIGTSAVPGCMLDLSRADAAGHANYLKLTVAEKAEIVRRLRPLAGESPEDETADDNRPAQRLPALVLWRWFRQPWHGTDER